MSFAAPLFLLALALVPLAVVAYIAHERRRRVSAGAFASPAVFASVATTRPAWRRHVPPALYALALVPLVFALARPQATVAVPDERAAIVLATDHSGSMQATDVSPNRLDAARSAVRDFLDEMPRRIQVGLVAFDHSARMLEAPTTDRAAVLDALETVRPSGGTATGEAIAAALAALDGRGERGHGAPAAIVLLSDGASTSGRDPIELARDARRLGIPIHTVALGTETGTIEVPTRSGGTQTRRVPPDAASLRAVAEESGGRDFSAADADSLHAVYEELGSRVGRRDEKRELTAAFAGGALALLAVGGLMSLHWFRRAP